MPRLTLTVVCLLITAAGCASKTDTATPPAATAQTSVGPDTATTAPAAQGTPVKSSAPAPAPAWPSPEDCVSYNPGNLTKNYAAGFWGIFDGSKMVARAPGGPGENVGDQAIALARRYKKHCFLGRLNTREEKYNFIFDYWMDSSGSSASIPDENCSNYNKNNLTVEDMGSGHGWRVKDHDHVLHLFDKQSDASNGKLVIGKYTQICNIGHPADGNEGQEYLNYFKG